MIQRNGVMVRTRRRGAFGARSWIGLIVVALSLATVVTAFVGNAATRTTSRPCFSRPRQLRPTHRGRRPAHSFRKGPSTTTTTSALFSSAESNNDNPALELSRTLSRLDRQWKLQQKAGSASRWTKLVLEAERMNDTADNNESDDQDFMREESFVSDTPSSQDFCYLLEPPNKGIPSCLLVFWGGTGLGSFPQVAYNEFLLRLSDRLNAAVLAAPYQVGLDHFDLAKTVGELHRRAVLHCRDDPARLYPTTLPTYCLTHSLGGKLATIYTAATDMEYNGVGMISFNNFGFSKTIGMAKDFAQELSKTTGMGDSTNMMGGMADSTMDTIFTFAENLLGTIGVEFSPNPTDMERLISLKYNAPRQRKTRLFVFDDDALDSSADFVRACRSNNNEASDGSDNDGPQVSALPGTHLTPVFFQLSWDTVPEEARNVAREFMARENSALGGLQSASFGSEEELQALVEEVAGFVLGRPPSRQPERPLLEASTTSSSSGSSGDASE